MGLLEFFWLMLWFFLFFIWIWLLISIFGDIFRNEMSGFAKAIWVIFVIVTPLLGVLIYLTVHGSGMQERTMKQAAAMEKAQRQYIQEAAGGASTADEIAKLNDLKNSGAISQEEFDSAKAKLLA